MPKHGVLEFNPLRLSVVAKWMRDNNANNTYQLQLRPGRNANAAVHDDNVCRPVYDSATCRWMQRCVACARLGSNAANTEMSLALRRRRVKEMERFITGSLNQDYHAEQNMSGLMSPELVQRLKVAN